MRLREAAKAIACTVLPSVLNALQPETTVDSLVCLDEAIMALPDFIAEDGVDTEEGEEQLTNRGLINAQLESYRQARIVEYAKVAASDTSLELRPSNVMVGSDRIRDLYEAVDHSVTTG